MIHFYKYFYCSVVCMGVTMCLTLSPHAYAALATSTISEIIQDATVEVKRTEKAIQDTQTAVVDTIDAKTSGFKKMINDKITAGSNYLQDQYKGATDYVDGKIQAAGDYAMEQAKDAGEYVMDSFSSSDSEDAGSGFSLSQKLGCLKESVAKYSKYIAPVKSLVTGDIPGTVTGIRDVFYTKTSDNLSTYSVTGVQSNLKKFVQEATKTAIGDATQIMNGTSQYEKVQESAKDEGGLTASSACKPTNVREDIEKSNSAAMTMNIMANTLLSMDVTELSIQSATIYDNINTISLKSVLMGK